MLIWAFSLNVFVFTIVFLLVRSCLLRRGREREQEREKERETLSLSLSLAFSFFFSLSLALALTFSHFLPKFSTFSDPGSQDRANSATLACRESFTDLVSLLSDIWLLCLLFKINTMINIVCGTSMPAKNYTGLNMIGDWSDKRITLIVCWHTSNIKHQTATDHNII